MPRSIAAVLAAGAGARFAGGGHKLLAVLRGRPVWEWAVAQACDAGFDDVVVITGAVELPLGGRVLQRHNPDWEDGQASSLQVAIRAADELGGDAVTVGLADQPFVTTAAWRAVAAAPQECRIVVATYDGRRGPNPVRLHRSVWPMLPVTGDEGGRGLLRAHPELVCEVPCVGSVSDIDTLEDLARWNDC